MINKVMTYVPVASLCTSTMCLFLQLIQFKTVTSEVRNSSVHRLYTRNIDHMIAHHKMRTDTELDIIKKNVELIKSILELEKEKEDQEEKDEKEDQEEKEE